jgi:hypothetical protein
MTTKTGQPIPDTDGEWRQHEHRPSLIITNVRNEGAYYDIIASTRDAKLPGHTATQIVADHKAAKSQALLIDALHEARGFACQHTWGKEKVSARRAEALVCQIDAALKVAGVEEK